ncbi:MAG: heme-degrading domain-containing protein [Spirochaetota bacterium]
MSYDLKTLLKQELDLEFDSFSNADAWNIGYLLRKKADQEKHMITIDITRLHQQLFHFSLAGTSLDNDEWVRRKTRIVYRFSHSSLYVGTWLKSLGTTIEEKYLLPESEYAPHGGSFPILIRNTGVIGTVTVSGLAQEEDHDLVVEALSEYLG